MTQAQELPGTYYMMKGFHLLCCRSLTYMFLCSSTTYIAEAAVMKIITGRTEGWEINRVACHGVTDCSLNPVGN